MSTKFIGIDLGTTNSSLAFSHGGIIENALVNQAVGEDLFKQCPHLPSFLYLPPQKDLERFKHYPGFEGLGAIAGTYARSLSTQLPGQVVQSAKSWISLSNENSQNRILPFKDHEVAGVREEGTQIHKLSPVEAQSAYLKQFKSQLHDLFESSNIVVTVPASFDEFARRLTLDSIESAGIENAVLVEEPLAAFYNWMHYGGKKAQKIQTVLVADMGGGTTDFSLLERKGSSWSRRAVGDHLLLGGDNMDLALLVQKERELNRQLDPQEFIQVLGFAREVKEEFLQASSASQEPEVKELRVLSSGSRLFQHDFEVRFSRDEVLDFILDGFFPVIAEGDLRLKEEAPVQDLGLKEFGLPYAKNPVVTIHLHQFLKQACPEGPDAVLFHGGALQSSPVRSALLENLKLWFSKPVQDLKNPDPLLGVSHGACIYAMARAGLLDLIHSGLAHNLFMKVEEKGGGSSFTCVAAAGQEEGKKAICPAKFQVKGNQQVQFPLYRSKGCDPVGVGEILDAGDTLEKELLGLPPVFANLPATHNFFPVQISSEIASTGELKLYLDNARDSEQFELNFETRLHSKEKKILKIPPMAEKLIQLHYGGGQVAKEAEAELKTFAKKGPRGLLKQLEKIMGTARMEWGVDLSRFLAKLLIGRQKSRRKSELHEQAWFNAVGFFLRPGMGHPLDKELIGQLIPASFIHFPKVVQNRLEYWIFLRRISGGLSEALQNILFESYAGYLRGAKPAVKLPGPNPGAQEMREMLKCFVCFEYLKPVHKENLFRLLMDSFSKGSLPREDWWLFSRLLSRVMQYAGFGHCLPTAQAHQFFKLLLKSPRKEREITNILGTLFHHDENRRVAFDEKLKDDLISLYNLKSLHLDQSEEERYSFGESLPLGLKII